MFVLPVYAIEEKPPAGFENPVRGDFGATGSITAGGSPPRLTFDANGEWIGVETEGVITMQHVSKIDTDLSTDVPRVSAGDAKRIDFGNPIRIDVADTEDAPQERPMEIIRAFEPDVSTPSTASNTTFAII